MHELRIDKLEDHIKKNHKRSAVSGYFKEVVYGGIDGIVTTFAVVSGFSGAALSNEATTQLSFLVVLLFGLANLFADATSMGLGNFLSVRSDQDLYTAAKRRLVGVMRSDPRGERDATVEILKREGFTEADAEVLTKYFKKNPNYWTAFMMRHELGMSDPYVDNPVRTGLATFFAFLAFGVIPLIPFMLMTKADPGTVFALSSAGTFLALVLLGLLKWRVIGTSLLKSLAEVVVVGGVAAVVAFLVGSLFTI